MTFPHFNRRLHLYLGVALLPWFFMYGISSIPFAHNTWFRRPNSKEWRVRFDRPYSIAVPAQGDLRPTGAAILRDNGMDGAFGVFREGGNLHIFRHDLRSATRITYFPGRQRLLAEDRPFYWSTFLTEMHARGGFQQPGFLPWAWSILVDVVCLGILVWIASGLYMWWHVRGHRGWGWLALASGAASFAIFVLAL